MSNGLELAKQGLCECCQAKVHHGPYTDAQIAEICEDLGTEVSDFSDWCDDCFVGEVGLGDAVYAETLAKRRLQVTKLEYIAQLGRAQPQAALQAQPVGATSDGVDLTKRAIAAHLRQPGAQQPAANLSGPATVGGLDYIVLRNVSGVLAVFRVLPISRTLKRLKRWPAAFNDQAGSAT